jgi:hypothetical protein
MKNGNDPFPFMNVITQFSCDPKNMCLVPVGRLGKRIWTVLGSPRFLM